MMPQMPSMPSPISSSGESHESSSSPFAKDSVDSKSAGSDVGLNVPSHEPVKPVFNDPSANNSQVSAPLKPKKGIEVVAIRKGFYNQERKKEGDKFLIRSEEEFGEWMKCVEPAFEKKRIEFYKSKKAKK